MRKCQVKPSVSEYSVATIDKTQKLVFLFFLLVSMKKLKYRLIFQSTVPNLQVPPTSSSLPDDESESLTVFGAEAFGLSGCEVLWLANIFSSCMKWHENEKPF